MKTEIFFNMASLKTIYLLLLILLISDGCFMQDNACQNIEQGFNNRHLILNDTSIHNGYYINPEKGLFVNYKYTSTPMKKGEQKIKKYMTKYNIDEIKIFRDSSKIRVNTKFSVMSASCPHIIMLTHNNKKPFSNRYKKYEKINDSTYFAWY